MQMVINWLGETKTVKIIKSIGVLIFPITLYVIPIDWIKNQHKICLFKNITGHDCYGCGITRAILSALHLSFNGAFTYNKLVILVLPLLIFIWTKILFKNLRQLL